MRVDGGGLGFSSQCLENSLYALDGETICMVWVDKRPALKSLRNEQNPSKKLAIRRPSSHIRSILRSERVFQWSTTFSSMFRSNSQNVRSTQVWCGASSFVHRASSLMVSHRGNLEGDPSSRREVRRARSDENATQFQGSTGRHATRAYHRD